MGELRRVELVMNMRRANGLGLSIPEAVLIRGGPGTPAMRNREEEAEVMPRRVGLVRADQAIQ